MDKLVQIVATTQDGELPVGLSPFLPLPDARKQFAELQKNGYGTRQVTRPVLGIRDQSGATVDPPKLSARPSSKSSPDATASLDSSSDS